MGGKVAAARRSSFTSRRLRITQVVDGETPCAEQRFAHRGAAAQRAARHAAPRAR